MDSRAAWQDWFALILVISSTVALLCGIFGILKWKTYPSLQVKNVPILAIMGLAGVVHMFAILIYNGHFNELRRIEHFSCVLWNYWLPYFFGLCPWFIGVFMRLIIYGSVYSGHLSELGYNRIRKYKWFCIIGISLPLFVSLFIFTLIGASSFDEVTSSCQSTVELKTVVVVWIALVGLLLCIAGFIMKYDVVKDYQNEFMPLLQIIVVGAIVLCINGGIAFLHLQDIAYWRSVATCNVVILHLFSFFRIVKFDLFKAIIGDESYATKFRTHLQTQELNVVSIADIRSSIPCVFDDFMRYCAEDRPMMLLSAGNAVKPLYFVNCYVEINNWKNGFPSHERHGNCAQTFERFSKKYLYDDRHAEYIRLSDELRSKIINADFTADLFNELEEWIIETLDSFFGKDYLCTDIYHRRIYNGTVVTQFSAIKRQKLHRRQTETNLASVHSFRTEHNFNEDDDADAQSTELQNISSSSTTTTVIRPLIDKTKKRQYETVVNTYT